MFAGTLAAPLACVVQQHRSIVVGECVSHLFKFNNKRFSALIVYVKSIFVPRDSAEPHGGHQHSINCYWQTFCKYVTVEFFQVICVLREIESSCETNSGTTNNESKGFLLQICSVVLQFGLFPSMNNLICKLESSSTFHGFEKKTTTVVRLILNH